MQVTYKFGFYLNVLIEKKRSFSGLKCVFFDWKTFKEEPKLWCQMY